MKRRNKSPKRQAENKEGNRGKNKFDTRKIIASCLGFLGSVSFGYGSAIGALSVWFCHIGALIIFIAIGLLLYKRIRSWILFPALVAIFIIVVFSIEYWVNSHVKHKSTDPDLSVEYFTFDRPVANRPIEYTMYIKNWSPNETAQAVEIRSGLMITRDSSVNFNWLDTMDPSLINEGEVRPLQTEKVIFHPKGNASIIDQPQLDSLKRNLLNLFLFGKFKYSSNDFIFTKPFIWRYSFRDNVLERWGKQPSITKASI